MDVLALLDKLDAYLSECSRLPLVGKLLVDEDEVFSIIDDLRAQLPQEMEQAKWLLKERERILQEARKESEEIVKDAQGQIASLASESTIAKEARVQAEELMARAKDVAREINLGAREYADELMKAVEDAVTETLDRVRQGRRELSIERDSIAAKPAETRGDGASLGEEEADTPIFEDDGDEEEPSRGKRRRKK